MNEKILSHCANTTYPEKREENNCDAIYGFNDNALKVDNKKM